MPAFYSLCFNFKDSRKLLLLNSYFQFPKQLKEIDHANKKLVTKCNKDKNNYKNNNFYYCGATYKQILHPQTKTRG